MKAIIGGFGVIAILAGGAAGWALREPVAPVAVGEVPPDDPADRDYVKIGRQIVVPVVKGGATEALMLFEVALDVPLSLSEPTYRAEPRLRDAFLKILFEMSYTGAFSDTYTDDRVIAELRSKLLAAARAEMGPRIHDVLILDVIRQEL